MFLVICIFAPYNWLNHFGGGNMDTQQEQRRIAFVTGGSGFVGERLIARLVATGWTVRALARSRSAASAVAALGATPIDGDITEATALKAGMTGSHVVFHVAALFKLWGDPKDFDQVNVGGTLAVVDTAAATESVTKVIAVSAAAVVMGDPEPMMDVTETAPLQRRHFAPYALSKAEAERILLAANGRRRSFETIAIRPPMIWGAGMPTLDHMVETVEAGQWQWVGGGSQAMSTCHVDNLVHALLLAADSGTGGEAYFVADAETGTLKSVIAGLLATQGVRAADKSVSFGLAWMIAGVMGVVWRLFRLAGEPPITRQMLRLIGKPFTVSTEKARRQLGYAPQTSWEEGTARMSLRIERGLSQ
jgi:nucleoside-diphosphate-sugar epimerase